MKQFRISLGFVLVLFLVLTGALFAEKADKEKKAGKPMLKCEDMFSDLDVNKDGKIDLKEFTAKNHPSKDAPRGRGEARGPRNPEELFKERDRNNDGFLTKEEFCSKGDPQRDPRGKPRK